MKSFDLIVAQNIKLKLQEHGKKQTELAEKLGVQRQTVNKILSGKRMITARDLILIADFFGCPLQDLTVDNGQEKEECPISAFFMGEVSKDETKERFKLIFELSRILSEQIYASEE